jgi:hypothetical protein
MAMKIICHSCYMSVDVLFFFLEAEDIGEYWLHNVVELHYQDIVVLKYMSRNM